VAASGETPVPVVADAFYTGPSVSRDGRWLIYSAFAGELVLRRVSVDGGEPENLVKDALNAQYSPDGTMLATLILNVEKRDFDKLGIFPADGGEPIKTFPIEGTALGSATCIRWTPDSKNITYIKGPVWEQSLAGGLPKKLASFELPTVFSVVFSPDGKQVALERGEVSRNAILISGLR
jgi:hypothetical protein